MIEVKIELVPPTPEGISVRIWRQVAVDADTFQDVECWDIDDFDPTVFLSIRPGERFVVYKTDH